MLSTCAYENAESHISSTVDGIVYAFSVLPCGYNTIFFLSLLNTIPLLLEKFALFESTFIFFITQFPRKAIPLI